MSLEYKDTKRNLIYNNKDLYLKLSLNYPYKSIIINDDLYSTFKVEKLQEFQLLYFLLWKWTECFLEQNDQQRNI